MFKQRTHGSRKSGGFKAPQIFGQSSTQSAPLLASAQNPGISQNNVSQASLGSYNSPPRSNSSHTGPMSSQTSSNARYGPTASVSPQPANAARFAPHGTNEQPPMRAVGGPAAIGGIAMDEDDLDDQLHTFSAADRKDLSSPFTFNSWRGWANGITLFILMAGFVVLFAGYPIIDWYYGDENASGGNTSGFNLGGVNASGQYPDIPGFPSLIDPETPQTARSRVGTDGSKWELVFSDEFNKDGRTFYPGDDPFFTAVDIHYWPTNDFEWYDPGQVTTAGGYLVITIEQEPTHDLMFKSGMLQSWNQLCFNKNAYFEVAASLPGKPSIGGFWPGIWTMGNLGRPGYGASTDGLWPYSYTACDAGVLANQTLYDPKTKTYTPAITVQSGHQDQNDGTLSFLPGQRLSACNCAGSGDHPGPAGVGRGAVEIDMIEAQTDPIRSVGQVSQSAQVAPFDIQYEFVNTSAAAKFYDPGRTMFNTYKGGVYQEAVSALTDTCSDCTTTKGKNQYYRDGGGEFAVYGFEYVANVNDRSKGYIEWVTLGTPSWRMEASTVGPVPELDISQRLITEEPMALVFNLGMSNNFENVNFGHLNFPNQMRIDYIRVYQLPNTDASVGCDPPDRPTAAYIQKYADVYNNPNLTTWEGAGYKFPTNKAMGSC